jgi:hypothetical protein
VDGALALVLAERQASPHLGLVLCWLFKQETTIVGKTNKTKQIAMVKKKYNNIII